MDDEEFDEESSSTPAEVENDGNEEETGGLKEISTDHYESVEKDFHEVLQDLIEDHRLDKFRFEYEKLFKSLEKSHDSETRLMSKCRELNAEIVANSAKLSKARILSNEDETMITKLKKDVELEYKKVEEAHEKEDKYRNAINQFKIQIAKFNEQVKTGDGLTPTQRDSWKKLLEEREVVTAQRDEELSIVMKLREQLSESAGHKAKLEKDTAKAEGMGLEIQEDIHFYESKIQKETLRRDRIQFDVTCVNDEMEAKSDDITAIGDQIEKYKIDLLKLDKKFKEKHVYCERYESDLEVMRNKCKVLSQEYDIQLYATDMLALQNQSKVFDLKQRRDEVEVLKAEAAKLNKVRDIISRKMQHVEDGLVEVEVQKENFRVQTLIQENYLESHKKQCEADKKFTEGLMKERDMLHKNLQKATGASQKQLHLVKLHEQSKSKLEKVISKLNEEAATQRKFIFKLEKERDYYISEASELTQKVLEHMEDIKEKEMHIFNFKKKVAESETKMHQQQNLYEAVLSDRLLYNKNLLITQEEISRMKHKLRTMIHSIDQLTVEKQQKQMSLIKEYIQFRCVLKEKDEILSVLSKKKKRSNETASYINALENEEKQLVQILAEADVEKFKQNKELNQVVIERDILGTQLVRRNEELTTLYEKIKTWQSLLNQGRLQFDQVVKDISVMKIKIKKLKSENTVLRKRMAHSEEVKRDVIIVRRKLLHKRTCCKTLEEELKNPMNIHRWKKLQGNNSIIYNYLLKFHTLQKKFIHMSDEVEEKEILIQEKEKLYFDLKNIQARQPGPEVAEQLQIYQGILKDKNRQIKALENELQKYNLQVKETSMDLKIIKSQLQDIKASYFSMKRKEKTVREHNKILEKCGVHSI